MSARCPNCGHRIEGQLLDVAGVMRELGIPRSAAEAMFRQLPKVHKPAGLRKTYVRRRDLERLIDDATVAA